MQQKSNFYWSCADLLTEENEHEEFWIDLMSLERSVLLNLTFKVSRDAYLQQIFTCGIPSR